MNWGVCWFEHQSLINEVEQVNKDKLSLNLKISKNQRHDASLHLLNLINELAQLRLDFNKKLKQICKRHYLKSNKQSDTCFNAYKALLDFIHYTRDTRAFD